MHTPAQGVQETFKVTCLALESLNEPLQIILKDKK